MPSPDRRFINIGNTVLLKEPSALFTTAVAGASSPRVWKIPGYRLCLPFKRISDYVVILDSPICHWANSSARTATLSRHVPASESLSLMRVSGSTSCPEQYAAWGGVFFTSMKTPLIKVDNSNPWCSRPREVLLAFILNYTILCRDLTPHK